MGMASLRRNIVASLLFGVFGGPGILLFWVPFWLTGFRRTAVQPLWQVLFGSIMVLIGLVPLAESMVRFIRVGGGTLVPVVPTESLVVSGLYRYMRNPMYVGVLISLGGEALLFRSTSLALLLLAVGIGMHLFVCFYEEPALARRYPHAYREYRRHVRRWLPRLTRWRSSTV
jgi:protein-S-isoprenylcysteine O-methyltransferase Ste14